MSERDQRHDGDDLDDQIAWMEAAGVAFPVSDATWFRYAGELEPQAPSPDFQRRISELLATLRATEPPDLGATLASWREAAKLSLAVLRARVHIDSGVLAELESNHVYPETLSESFWREYAMALALANTHLADLIASYDRTKISVGGVAAARATKGMRPEQRAAFLGEADGEHQAQLDRLRQTLTAGLRR